MASRLQTLLLVSFLGLTKAADNSGCGKQPAANVNATTLFNVTSSSTSRNFLVHVPPGYDNNLKYPVVLAFHGNTETAQEMELDTRLSHPQWSSDVTFTSQPCCFLCIISSWATVTDLVWIH
jgi:poly(3-hydroxybutyrate) depolymerase